MFSWEGKRYSAEIKDGDVIVGVRNQGQWTCASAGAWEGRIVGRPLDLGEDAYAAMEETLRAALESES